MIETYPHLARQYGEIIVNRAIYLATTAARGHYKKEYTMVPNFTPHAWVIEGICMGLAYGIK